MAAYLLKWVINSISLLAVVNIVPGITVNIWATVIIAALVLGLLNALLRPLVLLLTLPVNILTLGLFTLFVNAALFYLASFLVKGFHVSGFWSAFLGALVFSIISFMLSIMTRRA